MRIRTGRRNKRNLYLQLGDEPGNDDPCLGLMIDPEVSVILTVAVAPDDAELIGFALARKGPGDTTGDEPACAMYARGPDGSDRWFYPADLAEAREYAAESQARPIHPWRGSTIFTMSFPWTEWEVLTP